jgi:hypothetical protein
MNIKRIIGLTVVAIKGEYNSKGKYIEPKYILFNDGKTYIDMEDQDYIAYHDCASSAKHINIRVSGEDGYTHENVWNLLMTYPDATTDL